MTESFDTDAGVAAWIRRQVTELASTDTYTRDPGGDSDIIHDFQPVINEYVRRQERASLARIRGRFVERGSLAARRETPERDVSLPWLHGS